MDRSISMISSAARRAARFVIVGSLFCVVMAGPAAPVAAADYRCGGLPGIQVWSDAGYQGMSAIWCSSWDDSYNGWTLAIPDFRYVYTSYSFLYFSWNDRISSFQAFNLSPYGYGALCQDSWYRARNLAAQWDILGDTWVSYVGDAANDQASSVWLAKKWTP
jgi:hypothetical protein